VIINHVAQNRAYGWPPFGANWMAEQLRAAAKGSMPAGDNTNLFISAIQTQSPDACCRFD